MIGLEYYDLPLVGPPRITLVVTLRRADGTTAVATATHVDPGETVAANTITLSTAEANSIPSADYATGLVVEVSATVA